MSELERIFKDTLVGLERELSNKLMAQSQTLAEHQKKLMAQDRELKNLKEQITRLQQEQQEGEKYWIDLNTVSKNLEPLLLRLNTWLNNQS
jgi:septal ring factor EnvC (AmiA/AmiB activator)